MHLATGKGEILFSSTENLVAFALPPTPTPTQDCGQALKVENTVGSGSLGKKPTASISVHVFLRVPGGIPPVVMLVSYLCLIAAGLIPFLLGPVFTRHCYL